MVVKNMLKNLIQPLGKKPFYRGEKMWPLGKKEEQLGQTRCESRFNRNWSRQFPAHKLVRRKLYRNGVLNANRRGAGNSRWPPEIFRQNSRLTGNFPVIQGCSGVDREFSVGHREFSVPNPVNRVSRRLSETR